MSADLFDVINTLIAAASGASDLQVKTVYLAEARIRVAAAQAKFHAIGLAMDGQERELVRLASSIAAEGGAK